MHTLKHSKYSIVMRISIGIYTKHKIYLLIWYLLFKVLGRKGIIRCLFFAMLMLSICDIELYMRKAVTCNMGI